MTKNYFEYSASESPHALFPLGGVGAGSISIGSDGRLKDWEILNRPSKGGENGFTHFALKAEHNQEVIDTRILHGPFGGNKAGEISNILFNGTGFGANRNQLTGFPSFAFSKLTGPYPVAVLDYQDPKFPGKIRQTAFSPYLPLEDRSSSMPIAMFEFEVTNPTSHSLDYTLYSCLGLQIDQPEIFSQQTKKESYVGGRSRIGSDETNYGELCLMTDHLEIGFQRNLYRGNWFDRLEVYWQDISRPGRLKDRCYDESDKNMAFDGQHSIEHTVLAIYFSLGADESKTIRVALSWFVPNVKKYWNSTFQDQTCCEGSDCKKDSGWKNYYSTQWSGAVEVAREGLKNWEHFSQVTKQFQTSLVETTIPLPIKDAVTANLSIIKTPTALRLQDGTFYGWEGCHMQEGCCEGSCTHVWGYQQVLPFLYPKMQRSKLEADLKYNLQDSSGAMAFRTVLPLGAGISKDMPCADGQFVNVLQAYRDWKLCGDIDWLASIWSRIKLSISFAWSPQNPHRWDSDQSGILTGRQHHTLDMELFGANSWLTGLYLGALKAGAEMADALKENDLATLYRSIFERGRKWVQENLFNGSHFIQKIDLGDKGILDAYAATDKISYVRGSIYDLYWSEEHQQIKYQIGEGCEIDQVLAQWHAELYGLGDLFEREQFKSAVNSIYQLNYLDRLGEVPNPCRVFGMENESGTQMCAWKSERPAIPIVYSQETMHGFEYAFGCQLMMADELSKAVTVFKAVRDRYRGNNRNPWNEIECGSNYARSMSSFSAILCLSGFQFDGNRHYMKFDPKVAENQIFKSFWSNGLSWGTIEINSNKFHLSVYGGKLLLKNLSIGEADFNFEDFKNSGCATELNLACLVPGEFLSLESQKMMKQPILELSELEK